MSDRPLPPRSRKLVEATPLIHAKSGLKACVELTVYPDGHAGVAVSRIDGGVHNRTIRQVDSLPLNHVEELRQHVLAIIEHLAAAARASS